MRKRRRMEGKYPSSVLGESVSYKALNQAVNIMAKGLKAMGVREGFPF
jgi:hypothetical protein